MKNRWVGTALLALGLLIVASIYACVVEVDHKTRVSVLNQPTPTPTVTEVP